MHEIKSYYFVKQYNSLTFPNWYKSIFKSLSRRYS